MNKRKHYLYGVDPSRRQQSAKDNRTPILFEEQPDGGLIILMLSQDKHVIPDPSLYGLIHFDRDGLVHEISETKFKKRLKELGVSESAFDDRLREMTTGVAA
jgi:hypothetical protein